MPLPSARANEEERPSKEEFRIEVRPCQEECGQEECGQEECGKEECGEKSTDQEGSEERY